MLEKSMKAVVLTHSCEAADLTVSDVPIPSVRPGWVLVKVKAFGINHSEVILRGAEVDNDYIVKPVIPGIECAGEIEDPSDSSFTKGQRVISMMGGMGRSFNGSYAQYALLPRSHVFSVDTDLEWEELGAIPETFYTAYGSLTESLRLQEGETLLVRGATSTVGTAAVQLGKAMGATVIATSRSERRAPLLRSIGADYVIVDDATFRSSVLGQFPHGVDKVLELIGPKSLYESLRLVRRGGIVCNVGQLGGQFTVAQFDPIKYIPSGVYLTGFFSNYPSQKAVDELFSLLRLARIHPLVAGTFPLEKIAQVHALSEKGSGGKLVVLPQ